MARAFHLQDDAVEKLLHEDAAFHEVTIDGARGESGGEAIPPRPNGKASSFALNQDRIKALTEETHEVISMLSAVMADPEEAAPAQPERAPAVPHDEFVSSLPWLSGLDVRYHAAILTLARQDEIPNTDFDAIAAKYHLLPDDLMNAVNTWSDEALGDFLLERGENVRIYRALLPDITSLPVAA
jgi:hypothetical protein